MKKKEILIYIICITLSWFSISFIKAEINPFKWDLIFRFIMLAMSGLCFVFYKLVGFDEL